MRMKRLRANRKQFFPCGMKMRRDSLLFRPYDACDYLTI
jgi:hypothetical protein